MEECDFLQTDLFEKLKCGIVLFQAEEENHILYANKAYLSKFEKDRLLLAAKEQDQLREILEAGEQTGKLNCVLKDQSGNDVELLMFVAALGEKTAFAVLVNSTEQNAKLRSLEEKALFDPLTKVFNRATVIEKINAALAEKDQKSSCALIVLDIDNFKRVNDTFGHVYGDAVIAMAAGSVKNVLGEKDIMGRFGGDEFFAYIDDASEEALIRKLQNINKAVVDMRVDKGNEQDISCSIGVSVGNGSMDYEKMFREADSALYLAKKNGKNRYEFFDGKYHGNAISYGQDSDGESKNELSIAEIALEIASKSKSTESTIFNIMRHAAVVMGLEGVQIHKYYTKDGRADVEFEYFSELNGQYNVIKSVKKTGYYSVSDVLRFRDYLAENKQFLYTPEFKMQFSYKFRNVLAYSDPHTTVFSSTTEKNDEEFCVLCYKNFTAGRVWTKEDLENAMEITKILSVYMNSTYVATDREKAQERELMYTDEGAYRITYLYKRTGRMTMLAMDTGQLLAMTHFHIEGLRNAARKVSVTASDQFFKGFVGCLLKKSEKNHLVSAYDNFEDCVMLTVCDDRDQYEAKVQTMLDRYCAANPMPEECKVYIQASVCYFVPGMIVQDALMSARDWNLSQKAGKNSVSRVEFVKYNK